MSELRMASTRPSWMTQHRPKLASAVIRSSPPKSLPYPKRMRWSQAAPEIELTPPPESPTTAVTQAAPPQAEGTTQVVPEAGEPKTSILDELLGAAAPTSSPTVPPQPHWQGLQCLVLRHQSLNWHRPVQGLRSQVPRQQHQQQQRQ